MEEKISHDGEVTTSIQQTEDEADTTRHDTTRHDTTTMTIAGEEEEKEEEDVATISYTTEFVTQVTTRSLRCEEIDR